MKTLLIFILSLLIAYLLFKAFVVVVVPMATFVGIIALALFILWLLL